MEFLPLYISLLAGCFLSATVLPFSSEIILAGALYSGADKWWCLFFASVGNWGGGMLGYFMGYAGNLAALKKFMGIDQAKLEAWKHKLEKYSYWAAFFSWLPLAGDFMAVALGFFRYKIMPAAILMFAGKLLRYGFVIFAADYFF
jgi:membrane protein YqaA with SNARE-associated domain